MIVSPCYTFPERRTSVQCFPDDILEGRSELREKGRFEDGVQVWDSCEVLYGLPFVSWQVDPVPDSLPVYSWGGNRSAIGADHPHRRLWSRGVESRAVQEWVGRGGAGP